LIDCYSDVCEVMNFIMCMNLKFSFVYMSNKSEHNTPKSTDKNTYKLFISVKIHFFEI